MGAEGHGTLPLKAAAASRTLDVNQSVHSTIVSTTSRTILSQNFVNDTNHAIEECRYDFPLYDGVSVVGFTCQIGSRTIEGVVKEKTKAKEAYDEAVAKGKTAGLLAQGPTSDVFSTTLGNIPAGETVVVKVTYIGELKHDVGAESTKFTIPTSIAPRYGSSVNLFDQRPPKRARTEGSAMEITVDINMGSGSVIRELRSPSHPIAVKLGSTSVTSSIQAPQMSQASATLSQGSADLDKDFVLEIVNDIAIKPKAVLETLADEECQRALMITLVPTFTLVPAKPEIIIIADRSGSMNGNKITTLVRALKIFLKSLPVGICFNICSYGSRHTLLWDKSLAYGEESLALALEHVDGFAANYGGTETLAAVKASIEARDAKQDLALILCTDGDIWQQEELFSYLNTQLTESQRPIRVFPLGIGDSVSSGLIEGVARAGKGFASTVGEHEKLDGKIVRMLKGALTENITNYSFDVKYSPNEGDEDDDGFVLVDNIGESLNAMSLYEPTALTPDRASTPESTNKSESLARYGPQSVVSIPRYVQAPQEILPLYPATRTTIYVLISPNAPQRTPISVTLKGISTQGPISYEIPVDKIPEPGKTIHQLAARKAVGDLEEGRGWLVYAKDADGILLKDKFGAGPPLTLSGIKPKAAKFDEMVEREAVRLGVQYQVGGKFCSFVAVEGNNATTQAGSTREDVKRGYQDRYCSSATLYEASGSSSGGRNGGTRDQHRHRASRAPQSHVPVTLSTRGSFGAIRPQSAAPNKLDRSDLVEMAATTRLGSTAFGAPTNAMQGATTYGSGGFYQSARQHPMDAPVAICATTGVGGQISNYHPAQGRGGGMKFGSFRSQQSCGAYGASPPLAKSQYSVEDPLDAIISLQHFLGFWELNQAFLDLCGVGKKAAANSILAHAASCQQLRTRVWATIVATRFLERKMGGLKDTWELIVDKAKRWLQGAGIKPEEEAENEPLQALLSEL